jgi:predicted nucleic acid-binding protein
VATVVLDTSVLIALFKDDDRHHNSAVQATSTRNVYLISSVTLSEALVSAFRLNQHAGNQHNILIQKTIDRIVPIDEEIAVRAAEIRAQKNLSLPDAIISATAHTLKAQLWSCDRVLVKSHIGALQI